MKVSKKEKAKERIRTSLSVIRLIVMEQENEMKDAKIIDNQIIKTLKYIEKL